MSETSSAPSKKEKIIFFLKYSSLSLLIIVILGAISFAIFNYFYEIDGIRDSRYIRSKKISLDDKIKTIKDLYYKGRYIDTYKDSRNYSWFELNDFESDFFFKVKVLNSDNVEHLYKEAEKYNYEVQERYKKILKTNKDILKNEIQNDYEKYKKILELNIFITASKIMKRTLERKVRHHLYSLKFLNRILPKKLQIPTGYSIMEPDYRIFIKHDPVPDIYNYAHNQYLKPNLYHKDLFETAILFKTCGDYKDSNKLCVDILEKMILDSFSVKKFGETDDFYHYYENMGIISSYELIEYIYYYNNFGGDLSKLKNKFDDFTKSLYEQTVKDFVEITTIKSNYDLKKSDLNYDKKKEIAIIKEKYKYIYIKFEYLSSLKELKETYLITNFKVDPDLIKKSEEWLNKCNSFKKNLSDEYDKLNLYYE